MKGEANHTSSVALYLPWRTIAAEVAEMAAQQHQQAVALRDRGQRGRSERLVGQEEAKCMAPDRAFMQAG